METYVIFSTYYVATSQVWITPFWSFGILEHLKRQYGRDQVEHIRRDSDFALWAAVGPGRFYFPGCVEFWNFWKIVRVL